MPMYIGSIGYSSKYSDSFGIPREIAVPILNQFEKWAISSGYEWSIDRCKAIKLDFIRMKAGLAPVSSWIKSGKVSHFGGHFGALERWSSVSYKRWSKTILFLQHYTRFYSPKLTAAQENKFLSGVLAPPVDISEYLINRVTKGVKKAGIKARVLGRPEPLLVRPTSPSKREPHPNGYTYPEGEATLDCAYSYLYHTSFGMSMQMKYFSIFDDVMYGFHKDPTSVCMHLLPFQKPADPFQDSVGKIGLIQEAGYKLRAVANPARVYQQALKPLGDEIYNILKVLPWDCTHNQELPTSIIQRHLRNNQVAHCVDLSGATDNFPLSLQVAILDQIFPNSDYVSLFTDLSKAQWRYKDSTISWSKGQPLGLFPSFGSFALTHGLLLFALNNYKHDNAFFVLGDDVVILDDNLNTAYRSTLKDMNCPISENKSISSSVIAEFAGRIISSSSNLSQLKWRNPSDDSFLDVVRNIGISALSLLKPRQRRVAKALLEVPDFMGGLGFNPKGKPLVQRIEESLHLFDRVKNTSYLMSFNRKITSLFYNDCKVPSSYGHFVLNSNDFDQKSVKITSEVLPLMVKWYEIIGPNLYSINEGLPLQIDGKPSRLSTLQRYESKL